MFVGTHLLAASLKNGGFSDPLYPRQAMQSYAPNCIVFLIWQVD